MFENGRRERWRLCYGLWRRCGFLCEKKVPIDSENKHFMVCPGTQIGNESDLKGSSTSAEAELVLDKMEIDGNDDALTKKVSDNTESLFLAGKLKADGAVDLTELTSCSETQIQEVVELTGLECKTETYAVEFLTGKQTELPSESRNCMDDLCKESLDNATVKSSSVINDSNAKYCAENHVAEGNGDLMVSCDSNIVKEAQNEFGLETYLKDRLGETSNDDVHSEVSNPNISPRYVTSRLTISNQPLEALSYDHGGCGETTTSACSQTSSANDSSCKGKQIESYSLGSVSSSCVACEIPKHISSTCIRKITFKFSKRKEDYDRSISVPSKSNPLNRTKFHADHEHEQPSDSPSSLLNINSFQTRLWNTNERKDGTEYHSIQMPFACSPNMEMKMSKKIIPDGYPTNVKKLLSTRILEGARVKYVSVSGKNEVPGIIKDSGYLCGCSLCNFSKVVNAYEFELHAGTKTRHPNNHIYLENGKPIYSIIEELKSAPLSALDDVLKSVADTSVNQEYFLVWKENLLHDSSIAHSDSAYPNKSYCTDDSTRRYTSQSMEENPSSTSSCVVPFNQKSCIEDHRRPIKKQRCSRSYGAWEQKKVAKRGMKKRDNDLHKLLFLPNGLPDGTDLAYYAKGKRILGGYKQGNGIICSCCNNELSPSQFEAHAGWSAKRQPYRHIYASSGLTLHDIAVMLANGQSLVTGGSDDMCTVCGDGGKLVVCNGCPRAFHEACLGLLILPADDWNCQYCTDKDMSRKASRETRPVVFRLTRIVKAPEVETGGCIVCRSQAFSAVRFDDLTVILCDQCEKEYHVGCLRDRGMCDLKELPKDKWFCCDECAKIYCALQSLSSSGPVLIPTSVSVAMYRKHAAIGLNDGSNIIIQWRLLSGKSRRPDHLLLLSQAAAIFRECFDPIVAKSGRDLIPVMVYGRNISGQEFSGMYCVVLVVNTVVVSAALLRIFGREAAEIPLVATSRNNQGKGFFQALFSCIEGLLLSMNVENIVLPAAEEAEPMWTKKLGFTKASQEQMLNYTRDLQLTIFQGTSLLEKKVQQSSEFRKSHRDGC